MVSECFIGEITDLARNLLRCWRRFMCLDERDKDFLKSFNQKRDVMCEVMSPLRVREVDVTKIFWKQCFMTDHEGKFPKETYKALRRRFHRDFRFRPRCQCCANAMKDWAIGKRNAYTHWFQPLTGTARKNMTLYFPRMTQQCHWNFRGRIGSGGPDASSFPSGGLRPRLSPRYIRHGMHFAGNFLKSDASGNVTLRSRRLLCSYRARR